MALNSLSDPDLWALIVSDDYRAFTELYQRHWLRLYIAVKKQIPAHEACEAIIHDLFVSLWNRRAQLNISDFDSYLNTALRYQLYSYLKNHPENPDKQL